MSESCYCDYGEQASVYQKKLVCARKAHRCYECPGIIAKGDTHECVRSLYEGRWSIARTCPRCLDVRQYMEAHAPCFCWMHGSMLDDARETLKEYGHVCSGFFIGGMKRILRAERQVPQTLFKI